MALENDLGRDPIGKLVLRIAIPSMLAQFVSVLYSIVDRIYIGNIPDVGSLALAGVGVCGPIITLISAFAFWIGIGGSPLVSISMGENNIKHAKSVLANSFLILTVFSLLITLFSLSARRPLLELFGASENTLPYALDYFTIYTCGTVFALLSTGMNQFIICQGFAKTGMQSVILGAVLNIILDPIFIFVLDLEVRGAAIATVLSQIASCIFVLTFLFSGRPPIHITFKGYHWGTIWKILMTGLPPFVVYALDGIIVIGLNAALQHFGGPSRGDLLVAAATISQSFLLMVSMPLGGITAGTGSILGYNLGAGQPERIMKAEKYITILCLIYASIFFLIGQFCSAFFTHIFTPDPVVSATAVQAIRMATLGIIPLALAYVVIDGFTGMGLMHLALPLSLLRKGTYCCCILILPMTFDAMSIFLAEPISDIFPTVVSVTVYLSYKKKLIELAHRHSAPPKSPRP